MSPLQTEATFSAWIRHARSSNEHHRTLGQPVGALPHPGFGYPVIGEISRQTDLRGPIIDLAELAADLGRSLGTFVLPPAIKEAHARLRAADLIVIGVPVHKASYPGAFKLILDFLDPKALEGK